MLSSCSQQFIVRWHWHLLYSCVLLHNTLRWVAFKYHMHKSKLPNYLAISSQSLQFPLTNQKQCVLNYIILFSLPNSYHHLLGNFYNIMVCWSYDISLIDKLYHLYLFAIWQILMQQLQYGNFFWMCGQNYFYLIKTAFKSFQLDQQMFCKI